MSGFTMAEDPEESERLFRSMPTDELVANCLAAQKLIAEQIEAAEQARRTTEILRQKLGRLAGILRSAAGLKGRRGRVARDEALVSAARVLELIINEGKAGGPGGIVRESSAREVRTVG